MTITDYAALACLIAAFLALAFYQIAAWRRWNVVNWLLGPDDPENYE